MVFSHIFNILFSINLFISTAKMRVSELGCSYICKEGIIFHDCFSFV